MYFLSSGEANSFLLSTPTLAKEQQEADRRVWRSPAPARHFPGGGEEPTVKAPQAGSWGGGRAHRSLHFTGEEDETRRREPSPRVPEPAGLRQGSRPQGPASPPRPP